MAACRWQEVIEFIMKMKSRRDHGCEYRIRRWEV
jgi:hypothetical protein